MKINVKQAKEEKVVQALLLQAAQWLQSKGSLQWKGILEGIDNHDTPSAIERGEVYIAEIKKEPVGIFILWDHQSEWDEKLWGKDKTSDWLYLHRLTIDRSFSGKGLSSDLIEAAKEIGELKNKKGIRLDCMANKTYLNQLYQRNQFELLETVYQHDAGEQVADFNLYQFNLDC